MRTLIYTAFVSLDGVVDSPGGGSPSEAHRSSGWTYKNIEFLPEAYELKGREQEEAGAMMMGRTSYEAFSPVWPSMTEEFPRYKAMPKYVVSTTLGQDGLIDRYHLLVFPGLLGAGKRMFSDTDKDKQMLKLVESETYANGISKLVYDVVH